MKDVQTNLMRVGWMGRSERRNPTETQGERNTGALSFAFQRPCQDDVHRLRRRAESRFLRAGTLPASLSSRISTSSKASIYSIALLIIFAPLAAQARMPGDGPPVMTREAVLQASGQRPSPSAEPPDGSKGVWGQLDGSEDEELDAGHKGALPGVDVEEKLGSNLPLDLAFRNEEGAEVLLGDYFQDDKPTLLVLAYYRCPVLCGVLLRGVTDTLKSLKWRVGEHFRVVTVSIDPKDSPEIAGQKKESTLEVLDDPKAGKSWHFLTGNQREIDLLADAVGYRYVYDEMTKQYVHPAVSMVVGQGGLLSRYLYGVELRPFDLRMAILEAGEGKVGSSLDRFILSCYRYDPVSGKYVTWVFQFMRVGAFGILLGVGLLMTRLWRREQKGGANE